MYTFFYIFMDSTKKKTNSKMPGPNLGSYLIAGEYCLNILFLLSSSKKLSRIAMYYVKMSVNRADMVCWVKQCFQPKIYLIATLTTFSHIY